MSENITCEIEPRISIHKDIRFHPSLSSGEKLFFAELESLSSKNKDKKYPFSSRKLSDLFDVSHQTIVNWVKKLVSLNLIEIGLDYTNKEHKRFLLVKEFN